MSEADNDEKLEGLKDDSSVFTDDMPPAAVLPRWVPVLIGAVLVALAGLAVYTGMRYRPENLVRIVKPQRVPQAATPAPPGEPGPGASLVFPGETGDNAPRAHPPVSGSARAVITGTGNQVAGAVRIWARRGMTLNVDPNDAVVYVNDIAVGQAGQFSTDPYEFPQAGSYSVKLVAPGHRERAFVVTSDERAQNEVARITARLQPQ